MRVLVIGGLGNFGARICRRLVEVEGLDVLAAGRNPAVTPPAGVRAVHLDIAAPGLVQALDALHPNLVIHCAGPFQGQGYQVAEACCAVGAHYLDIADGRDFVVGFAAAVDACARAAGLCAVSGASSVPGLSSAVVDHLGERFACVEGIDIAIAPGQQAPRGTATIKAVFGYAGLPIRRLHKGRWRTFHGWQDLRRIHFAGLGTRYAAACDVPDLQLFPQRYPSVRTVQFRAALEVGVQHFALWLAAAARRLGLPLPIDRYAGQLDRFSSAFLDRLGSDLGGMRVQVSGIRHDGTRGAATWTLLAPNGDGPEIPCMAAILLALKLARGQYPALGACACVGLLTLDEFQAEFARWGITTRIDETA